MAEKDCSILLKMMKYDKNEWDNQMYVNITKESLEDAKPYALKQIIDAIMTY